MATANSKLKIDHGFDARGSSNVDGNLRVEGDFFVVGQVTSPLSLAGDLVPTVSGSRLGSAPLRWDLLANSANFSNTITVSGAATLTETLSVSKTISGGNTEITGWANATESVNSALLTVGSSFIANTTGAYHTGTVNAASFTTTNFRANTTGAYPLSNTTGTALGSTTQRWVLSANTGNFSGAVAVTGITTLTGNATLSGALQTIAGNAYLTGTQYLVGTANFQNTVAVTGAVTLSNTLTVTGVANLTSNLNISLNANVVGNATFASNMLLVNTGTSNTITVGAANVIVDGGVLFVDHTTNKVGINNTTPGVALRVDGAADISLTANVQGNANVGGTLGVAGITTLSANAVLNGTLQTIAGNVVISGTDTHTIAGNVAFDTNLLFVDGFNNKVGITTSSPTATLDIRNDASNLAIGTISASSNGFLANSSSIRVGNTLVNAVINTSSVNVATYLSGAIGASSNGFLANSSTIVVGNSTTNAVITTTSITVGNATQNTYIGPGDITIRDEYPQIVFVDSNAATAGNAEISHSDGFFQYRWTPLSGTSNTRILFDMLSGQHQLGPNNTNRVLIYAHDGFIQTFDNGIGTGGVWPGSNTSGSKLGEESYRWHLYASNGNFSDTVAIDRTLQINTISVSTNGFLSNSSSVRLGNTSVNVVANTSSITIQNGSTSSFINASSANVVTYLSGAITVSSNGFLANSSTITLGNTSVNVVVNTSSYTTGVIGAASNGFLANSSSIRVGNTSVNVVVNTSSYTAGVIGAASNGFLANSSSVRVGNTTVNTVITPSTISVGTISSTSNGFLANSTVISVGNSTSNVRMLSTGSSYTLTVGSGVIESGSMDTGTLVVGTGGAAVNGTFYSDTKLVVNNSIQANGTVGTAGQVLISGGSSSNLYWGTVSTSTFTSDLTINQTTPAIIYNDTTVGLDVDIASMYTQFNSGVFTFIQTDQGDGGTNTRFTFAMTTGNLTIDGELSATSDERKKDNIVTIDRALDKVDSMRGVYFTRKGSDEYHVGVIAQEIQKVLPEVVSEDADGYLSVSYGNIVGVLIEAIKELKQEIEELKNGNQS